jgi:hypothetical protein
MSQVNLESVILPDIGRRGSIEVGLRYASISGISEDSSEDCFRKKLSIYCAFRNGRTPALQIIRRSFRRSGKINQIQINHQ